MLTGRGAARLVVVACAVVLWSWIQPKSHEPGLLRATAEAHEATHPPKQRALSAPHAPAPRTPQQASAPAPSTLQQARVRARALPPPTRHLRTRTAPPPPTPPPTTPPTPPTSPPTPPPTPTPPTHPTPSPTPPPPPTRTTTSAPTTPLVPCFSHPSHANISTLLDLSGTWLDTPQHHVPHTFNPKKCAKISQVHVAEHPADLVPSTKAFAPHACSVERFSPSAFVEVLHDRTLFLLGDSLTKYFFNSLACLVAKPATMNVRTVSVKRLPGTGRTVCLVLTDTSVSPRRKARVCLVRVDQELSVGLWGLFKKRAIGPRDVVVANTGRHSTDQSTPEIRELIHQLPEEVRGDESTVNSVVRAKRFGRLCDWVRGQFRNRGPTFLWRVTFAAKFATRSGDYDPDQPAAERQCSSDMHGVDKQREKTLKVAQAAGLDTINAFEASALVDKNEYRGFAGDCTHFAQPSVYIYTAELLLAYLQQRGFGVG